jgi:GntR family negative regulator for fad regulon and positive regulator of fabA
MENNWHPPDKPAELTEARLISAILNGTFPANTNLPAERELAAQLGVTRPTLREALQRLGRDGWLEIHQGKPTRVRNYCEEGSLAVLGAIAEHQEDLPADFVPNLLSVRTLLAPAYTGLAIENNAPAISEFLQNHPAVKDEAVAYSTFDWELHHRLTIASGNAVFTLILNGFHGLYLNMGLHYFALPAARTSSRTWYAGLLSCAHDRNVKQAAVITQRVMQESLQIWQQLRNLPMK